MKYLIAAILSALISAAHAGTDYQCMSNCSDKGYLYSYCKSECSYGEDAGSNSQPQPIKSTDYQCLSDCTNKGQLYSFCKEKCSY